MSSDKLFDVCDESVWGFNKLHDSIPFINQTLCEEEMNRPEQIQEQYFVDNLGFPLSCFVRKKREGFISANFQIIDKEKYNFNYEGQSYKVIKTIVSHKSVMKYRKYFKSDYFRKKLKFLKMFLEQPQKISLISFYEKEIPKYKSIAVDNLKYYSQQNLIGICNDLIKSLQANQQLKQKFESKIVSKKPNKKIQIKTTLEQEQLKPLIFKNKQQEIDLCYETTTQADSIENDTCIQPNFYQTKTYIQKDEIQTLFTVEQSCLKNIFYKKSSSEDSFFQKLFNKIKEELLFRTRRKLRSENSSKIQTFVVRKTLDQYVLMKCANNNMTGAYSFKHKEHLENISRRLTQYDTRMYEEVEMDPPTSRMNKNKILEYFKKKQFKNFYCSYIRTVEFSNYLNQLFTDRINKLESSMQEIVGKTKDEKEIELKNLKLPLSYFQIQEYKNQAFNIQKQFVTEYAKKK